MTKQNYKAFSEFLEAHFTRVVVTYVCIYAIVVVTLSALLLWIGKISGAEFSAIVGSITLLVGSVFTGYVLKRGNEAWQERKTEEVKQSGVKPDVKQP